MTCAESEILLHALLDGELDAGHARDVEAHLEGCSRCAAQFRAYRELQQAMLAAPLRYTAPAGLRHRIERANEAARVHHTSGRRGDSLATCRTELKLFDQAEDALRRALTIYIDLLGSDSPMLGRSYDNLAVTEAMLEKFADAESLYREALKLRDGDDALNLRNLARVLAAQGKSAEAQPL